MADDEKGWFDAAGLQSGTRTLEEQMLGLDAALAECVGKTVLDAGCAEGLIGIEFARRGAKLVDGFDNNMDFVQRGRKYAFALPVRIQYGNLLLGAAPAWLRASYDIVLALAILHKPREVERATRALAELCADLLVIRLPFGSTGEFRAKHHSSRCDLHIVLPDCGFRFEAQVPGPRGEWVQYWRRRG